MKLNVGCGRNILPEPWRNIDCVALPGVDLIADLERCEDRPLPLEADSADEFLLSHLIEHIAKPLPLMQELHRIAKHGAKCVIRCPYGSSDDADEDPTHVRRYFMNSFAVFAQPYYWRADYGYRADWQADKITLVINRRYEGLSAQEVFDAVQTMRNVVVEMIAELAAVKPIREPKAELQKRPQLEFMLAN